MSRNSPISLVAEKLDATERVQIYLALHKKYLREAEDLYAKNDLLQAGEKYWGAVTVLLNAIAEKRGLPHYSHNREVKKAKHRKGNRKYEIKKVSNLEGCM
ncbi:PaREP1/PaREP8 domain containing family protein [Pyrobaculum arsenaticum DSM 13514]|uniref:PaREP1/PaREP8 domain containing family protein n=1 Tax=Pyrobaculum arsenaticum (strain DSM 13514 / JCM 11321 / PZ6) TaxID=340102 RepID=A4WJ96_PYRAR|nr:PaREP1/PaREP8 domain containing family protein [Pyrobaculum arsenaticum DSM 13514]